MFKPLPLYLKISCEKMKGLVIMAICFLIIIPTIEMGKTFDSDIEFIYHENLKESNTSHTALIEYASLSTSSSCALTSIQLYDLYASGKYDFYYVTLVADKNKASEKRVQELGISDYPSVYFDGNYKYISGEQINSRPYIDAIIECNSRKVNDVKIELSAWWSQSPCQQNVVGEVAVINEGENEYHGRLLIYIVEIDSRWKDYNGRPYSYSLFDIIYDENITIGVEEDGEYSAHFPWYAGSICNSDIIISDTPNILVMASVFSSGFSDMTVISRLRPPIVGDEPSKPEKPDGIKDGRKGEEYSYVTYSTDPDGDRIQYGWDWDGDWVIDEWTDFYESGEKVSINHTWDKKGSYTIRVKARDYTGLESFWSESLTVSMPIIKVKAFNFWSNSSNSFHSLETGRKNRKE